MCACRPVAYFGFSSFSALCYDDDDDGYDLHLVIIAMLLAVGSTRLLLFFLFIHFEVVRVSKYALYCSKQAHANFGVMLLTLSVHLSHNYICMLRVRLVSYLIA